MQGGIFINYRREDDSGSAGRLFDQLEKAFSHQQLFMDVDSIRPGLDFARVIDEQVAQCDVLLAVIGRGWLDARTPAGVRRLDDPEDLVRIEIEAALKYGKRVIPVLVGSAPMPGPNEVPEPIRPLIARRAVRLSHERFRDDTLFLIKDLQQTMKEAARLRRVRSRRTSTAEVQQAFEISKRLEAALRPSLDQYPRHREKQGNWLDTVLRLPGSVFRHRAATPSLMTAEAYDPHVINFDLKRDRHLFGPGPKRVLSLDGGGVRGIVSVAFLQRIGDILSQHHGAEVRLGDWFDLVGGTSTGAIIATALALGKQTNELPDIYRRLGPLVFKQPRWRTGLLKAIYDAENLRKQIEAFTGDRTLASEDLITGLCIVAKRLDTGSPWILSNDLRAPYWEDRKGSSIIGNKRYRLSNLVRASTAAPRFFDPEIIPIIEAELPSGEPKSASFAAAMLNYLRLRRRAALDPYAHGLFVDGGVTPHGNPALALFQMTQFERFGLCWPTGPDKLTVASIGTGTYRPRVPIRRTGLTRLASMFAVRSLESLMADCEQLVLSQMQWMGECPDPWEINSEVGTLVGDGPANGKLFRFLRYDVVLERQWLVDHLGIKVSDAQLSGLRRMDDPGMIDDIYEIAKAAAERQVKPEHWLPPAG